MRHRFAGVALVFVLLLGFVANGFAHRMGMSRFDIERVAYAQFWGEPGADLCATQGQSDSAKTMRDCDACRLIGAATLPPADFAMIDIALPFGSSTLLPPSVRGLGHSTDRAHAARAPPLA
ncbi:MAG: hypothetical protein WCC57_05960 [Paracoccaceae bacterium]